MCPRDTDTQGNSMQIFSGKARSGAILTSVLGCVGFASFGAIERPGAEVADVVAFKCSFSASAPSNAALGAPAIAGFEDLGGPVAVLSGPAPSIENAMIEPSSSEDGCTLLKRDPLVAMAN